MTPACVTVVDIGSGSMKASVFENLGSEVRAKAVVSRGFRLCSRIGGRISERKIDAAVDFFNTVSELSRRHGADSVVAVSTQAAREAPNFADLQNRVFKKFGIHLRVISGTDEAKMTALCIHKLTNLSKFTSIDIGCGSVEMAKFDGDVRDVWSLPISTINLDKMRSFTEVQSTIEASLANLKFDNGETFLPPLIGSGGTLKAASMLVSGGVRNVLTCDELGGLFAELKDKTIDERIVFGVPRVRADIFPFGALVALRIAQHIGVDRLFISNGSLRMGLAFDHFGMLK
ncbi:MAG: hypothetical protein LBB18_01740 [Puniceicoccales bacterium]|jgi:exopolyphosphatase/guanosine-5'-triphosphate,3'-diphosphate pyrophosphatase|nr:hypothetical protein [Puniceicoccales bacterium]